MFGRRTRKTEAWDARVIEMKSEHPDDKPDHVVTLTLHDGTTRRVHVRRKLWDSLHTGDKVRKSRGTRQLQRVA